MNCKILTKIDVVWCVRSHTLLNCVTDLRNLKPYGFCCANPGLNQTIVGTWRAMLLAHYDDVIMGTIASQITSLTIVYSTVYSGADQSKHQSSASLAFVWGIHRGPVNSPGTGEFPAQMASNAENVSIWWRHYGPYCMESFLLWLFNARHVFVWRNFDGLCQQTGFIVPVESAGADRVLILPEDSELHRHRDFLRFSELSFSTNWGLWPLLLTWFNFNPSMDK